MYQATCVLFLFWKGDHAPALAAIFSTIVGETDKWKMKIYHLKHCQAMKKAKPNSILVVKAMIVAAAAGSS